MEAEEKQYAKDEVIFREGEPSAAAFMVVQGRVELTRKGSRGPVMVGLLGPLDFFGETALFDDTPYDVTARAAEKTRIRVVQRAGLTEWLSTEPTAATRLGTMLAERLRAVHDLIVAQAERQATTRKNASILNFISQWFKKQAGKRRTDSEGRQAFQITLATLNNDVDGAWTRALAAQIEGQPGLALRILPQTLQIEPGADQAQAMAAEMRARQVLLRDQSIDLLVWGDVHAEGYSLWFSPQIQGEETRPGAFNLFFNLELPGDQEPPSGALFAAAIMAAIEPSEAKRGEFASLLRAAEAGIADLPGNLPTHWNLEQQRTALTMQGHALATLSIIDPTGPFAEQSLACYRAAALRLPPELQQGIDQAQLQKFIAAVLMGIADRNNDPARLEQAVSCFKAAIENCNKMLYPLEWGSLQNRLGVALYKLDLVLPRPDLLKEAMLAFQNALQAYPRQDAPERWAEIMHNLAQVLQVYGDQMKSTDVLERAIETIRAAIELRPRLKMPFEWASSQNTLGTAIFLLAKHSKSPVALDEATEAILGALEVYRQYGALRLAEVTEKNLARLQQFGKQRRPAPVQPAHWFEEEDEEPAKKPKKS